jgi:hypothetical protein
MISKFLSLIRRLCCSRQFVIANDRRERGNLIFLEVVRLLRSFHSLAMTLQLYPHQGLGANLSFTFKSAILIFFQRRPRPYQRPESFFAGTANRAAPVFGQIFKCRSFGDFSLSIPFIGVVNITAIHHLTLIHFFR